jgi:hypothetical protein
VSTVGPLGFEAQHDLFVATQVGFAGRHHFAAPALALGEAGVQARQVGSEQGRFFAAGAGADFQEGRARVVGVAGQQGGLQLVDQAFQVGFGLGDFFLSHGAQVGIVSSALQHLAGFLQVLLAAGVALGQVAHGADLGVFAREVAKTPVVGGDGGVGQGRVELLQAAGQAVER